MKRLLFMILAAGFTLGLAGCEKEGPAEKAGKEIDQAVEDVGEAIEEAGDEIRDETDG